jgi:hypothetical protein
MRTDLDERLWRTNIFGHLVGIKYAIYEAGVAASLIVVAIFLKGWTWDWPPSIELYIAALALLFFIGRAVNTKRQMDRIGKQEDKLFQEQLEQELPESLP